MLSSVSNLVVQSSYELNFGTIYVYEYIVVSIINEGILLDAEKCDQISAIAQKYFKTTIPFAYLTLRVNSYSVDPTIYFRIRHLKNLKAFAIVSTKEIDYYNFKIEQFFFKNNIKIFYDKKTALSWINNRLDIPSCR